MVLHSGLFSFSVHVRNSTTIAPSDAVACRARKF